MHTYQRDPDEECPRSWTYRLRGSDGTDEICSLPFGRYKSSHRFLSNTKQHDKHMEEIAIGIKVENALYH